MKIKKTLRNIEKNSLMSLLRKKEYIKLKLFLNWKGNCELIVISSLEYDIINLEVETKDLKEELPMIKIYLDSQLDILNEVE